jgi:hypothetical protein
MLYRTPLWLQNIEHVLDYDSVFIVHGKESKDAVILPTDAQQTQVSDYADLSFATFREAMIRLLFLNGYDALITYDINHSFQVYWLKDKKLDLANYLPGQLKDIGKQGKVDLSESFSLLPELINSLNEQTVRQGGSESDPAQIHLAVMVDYYSETDTEQLGLSRPYVEHSLLATYQFAKENPKTFTVALPNGETAERIHPVFWVVRDTIDMPGYLTSGIGIRQIPVSLPSREDRALAIAVTVHRIRSGENLYDSDEQREEWKKEFNEVAGASAGLSVKAINQIVFDNRGLVEKGKAKEWSKEITVKVKAYRVGLTENPWANPKLKDDISTGEETLRKAIYGQDQAIKAAVDLLGTVTWGFNGISSKDGGTAPRGCLFFAGPTGTGKTELAKQIAKFVFGSTEEIIRFDMSEYNLEHAGEKLVGSPPGYQGNEMGGQLTNKIKAKPFSVILFDEIEKAHPVIFDKFLQILSDGRLTDGRGDTVYFTEAIIIFTSNMGFKLNKDNNTGAEMIKWLAEHREYQPAEYVEKLKSVIRERLAVDLGKPELFGRIGEDNVVCFFPISVEVGRRIADTAIDNIINNFDKQMGIKLTISESARTAIIDECTSEKSLESGARGILHALDAKFVRQLRRFVTNFGNTDEITITHASVHEDQIELS